MADCWVRLGFALVAIVVITATFYQVGSRTPVAFERPAARATVN